MTKKEIENKAELLIEDFERCCEIEKEYLFYKIFDEVFASHVEHLGPISDKDKEAIIEKACELSEE